MPSPANALYTAWCEVLDATQQLRRASEAPGAAEGGGAVSLACLHATLDALLQTVEMLDRDDPPTGPRRSDPVLAVVRAALAHSARTAEIARRTQAGATDGPDTSRRAAPPVRVPGCARTRPRVDRTAGASEPAVSQ